MKSWSRFLASLLLVAVLPLLGGGGARAADSEGKGKAAALPKLLDFGSKKCIPCKKMAPILEELKRDYADVFRTEFIDVWVKRNAEAAKKHKIKLIPTQIFFDAAGKELWRHEGFMSKAAILAKWKELGVEVGRGRKGVPKR
jgi:thioredoxin 1